MNLFSLVWNYLVAKPLNTFLNCLLLALGIAVITILLLVQTQLMTKISDNAKGIDLVVGAKGSPLQLILCNIFHIDFPTGNIKLAEAEKLVRNKMIKKAIPMALGDSHSGYRIIGTNTDYPQLYHAVLEQGDWWKKSLEVVIGSQVAQQLQLSINDTFAGTHGLSNEGDVHEGHHYRVVGIMKKNNTVLDNLILGNIESVWLMHQEESVSPSPTDSSLLASTLLPAVTAVDSTMEITSLLIQYRSPMAAIQLPRLINSQSNMQAASPAFETARLFSILGVGVEVLNGFAYVLIVIAALSIFIALYNSLKERRYDMAIMRSMGATRTRLLFTTVLEGITMTVIGSVGGLVLAHGALMIIADTVSEVQSTGITGFLFLPVESLLLSASVGLGAVCALLPAIQIYRADISKVLASN